MQQITSQEDIQKQLDMKARRKDRLEFIIPYMGLGSLFIFFLIVTHGKLVSGQNLENLINQCFTLMIVAIGGAFVYAHGGSDMSVAASCGCGQLAAAILMTKFNVPLPVCILVCILTTVVGSMLTASVGLIFSVPVFIGSMCVRSVFNGILSGGTGGSKIYVGQTLYPIMSNTYVKFTVLVVMIAVGYYLFECTPYGKQNKAIGGNPNTAKQAGISTKKVMLISYIILGVCVGIAAMFQIFRNGEVTSQSGTGLEFNLMLAIILGGMPMRGGEKCRFLAAVVGALTVAVLENGLVLWGLDANLVNGVKGLLFVAIVALSYDKSQGKLVA